MTESLRIGLPRPSDSGQMRGKPADARVTFSLLSVVDRNFGGGWETASCIYQPTDANTN